MAYFSELDDVDGVVLRGTRISGETMGFSVNKPCVTLKNSIRSKYSCQKLTGRRFKDCKLVL